MVYDELLSEYYNIMCTCSFEIKFSAFSFSSLFAAIFQLSKIHSNFVFATTILSVAKTWTPSWLEFILLPFLPFDCHVDYILLQIFSFIDVEKSGTITFRQVTICNNLPCFCAILIRSSNWYYNIFTILFFVPKTAIQGSKCPCWLQLLCLVHLFVIVCCFQFLYGSAHVMSQPGFDQTFEEAFAGCGGAVKTYVVEQEVL